MAELFNPREILEIAVAVEKNGKELYAALEEKTDNQSLRFMWCYLKEQEEDHRRIFQEMIDHFDDYIAYEFGTGEYSDYLKAIAANFIITPKLIQEKKDELFRSDKEAVKFGISVEKESILTYSALKEGIKLQKQASIDKVIEEEKEHFLRLSAIKYSLSKED